MLLFLNKFLFGRYLKYPIKFVITIDGDEFNILFIVSNLVVLSSGDDAMATDVMKSSMGKRHTLSVWLISELYICSESCRFDVTSSTDLFCFSFSLIYILFSSLFNPINSWASFLNILSKKLKLLPPIIFVHQIIKWHLKIII